MKDCVNASSVLTGGGEKLYALLLTDITDIEYPSVGRTLTRLMIRQRLLLSGSV